MCVTERCSITNPDIRVRVSWTPEMARVLDLGIWIPKPFVPFPQLFHT